MFIEDLMSKIAFLSGRNVGLVSVDKIKFSTEFRDICETNSCGMYNRNWTCPPCVGSINVLIEEAKSYKTAIVYQTVSYIQDSFDIEGMLEAGQRQNELSISINEILCSYKSNKFLHLGAGGCKICKTCAKLEEKPCIYPLMAIPSLESHGISVYDLAVECGLNYNNGKNTVTYFGVVLIK